MLKWLKFNPALSVYYNISPYAIKFSIKALIGMTLALYIAFLLDFDRPYWAMISAIFLQTRPESGQVIQKGLFQLLATLLSGVLGLAILSFFVNAPVMIFISLAVVVFLLSSASALAPSFNYTYLCAMIAITTVLISVMPFTTSMVTSNNIFEIAIQRVSEIGIGSMCATVISMLLWPQRVRRTMLVDTNDLIEKIFYSMSFFLQPEDKAAQRHQALLAVINAVMVLENDTSPANYEAPNGPKLARTAHLINQRTLNLIAELQILGHLLREHITLMGPALIDVFEKLRQLAAKTLYTYDLNTRQKDFASFHRFLSQYTLPVGATSLQVRALQACNEIIQIIRVILDAQQAIVNVDHLVVKSEKVTKHYDIFLATIIGLRSTALFTVASLIWISTGWSMAFMMLVMPISFSITFAGYPKPTIALKGIAKGMVVAMPLGIIALLILELAPHDFEILIMVLSIPLFFGLLGFTNRDTIGYSLGFSMAFIMMILPGNHMVFDPTGSFERALAILLGVIILIMLFRIIQEPSALIMRRRLIGAIANDLAVLKVHEYTNTEQWFNGRMIGRIQRLAGYENTSGSNPNSQLNLIELGLLGLNIGRMIIRSQRNIIVSKSSRQLRAALRNWQQALAGAFQASAWGINDVNVFNSLSYRVLELMKGSHDYTDEQLQQFEGLSSRLGLSLLRNIGVSDTQIIALQEPHLVDLMPPATSTKHNSEQ